MKGVAGKQKGRDKKREAIQREKQRERVILLYLAVDDGVVAEKAAAAAADVDGSVFGVNGTCEAKPVLVLFYGRIDHVATDHLPHHRCCLGWKDEVMVVCPGGGGKKQNRWYAFPSLLRTPRE